MKKSVLGTRRNSLWGMLLSHPIALLRLGASLSILSVLCSLRTAQAQEELQPLPALAVDEIAEPEESEPETSDGDFNNMVFGQAGTAYKFRSQLEDFLSLKIEYVEHTCKINSAQKRKVELAGQGDIKRYFDRVSEERRAFHQVGSDQEKLGQVYQSINALSTRAQADLFDESSIFAKTLPNTLKPEQHAKYVAARNNSQAKRLRSTLRLIVAAIDTAVGLNDSQRQQLELYLRKNVRLPVKKHQDEDLLICLIQLSRLPEEPIKQMLDEDQWRLMRHLLVKFRNEGAGIDEIELLPLEASNTEIPAPVRTEADKPAPASKPVSNRGEYQP